MWHYALGIGIALVVGYLMGPVSPLYILLVIIICLLFAIIDTLREKR